MHGIWELEEMIRFPLRVVLCDVVYLPAWLNANTAVWYL